jgi:hypothetical protein
LLPVQSLSTAQADFTQLLPGSAVVPPHDGATGPGTHVVPAVQGLLFAQHLSLKPHDVGGGTGTTQVRNPFPDSATQWLPAPQSASTSQSPEFRRPPLPPALVPAEPALPDAPPVLAPPLLLPASGAPASGAPAMPTDPEAPA